MGREGGWGEGLSSRPLVKGGDLQKAPGLSLVLKIRGGDFRTPTLDPPLGNWVC